MSTAETARQAPEVNHPQHRPTQLTTYELREYRGQLESAIAFFDRQILVPPARDRLWATLAAVVAEQDDRARISRA
jgi:hypothetical protein